MTLRNCKPSLHLQPTLGGLAYWSMFANTVINSDRESGGLS